MDRTSNGHLIANFLSGLPTLDKFLFMKIWNLKNPFHPAFSHKNEGTSVSFSCLKSLLSNREPGGEETGFAAVVVGATGTAGVGTVGASDIVVVVAPLCFYFLRKMFWLLMLAF